MLENYQIIINKLDEFIRRYYKNKLIKGFLISLAIIITFYLTISFFEYFFHLGIIGRTIIFYLFLFSLIIVLLFWILIPLLQLFKLGKIISHEQAAKLIGQFFPEIDDQLLNTIQLVKLSEKDNINLNILNAGIEQKSVRLKNISFKPAIPYSGNKKYIKYTLAPILLLLVILLSAPKMIFEPTHRILKHDTFFEKEAPFKFIIENQDLHVVQNEDFELKVNIIGDQVPNDIFLISGSMKFKLHKADLFHFSYLFKTVNKTIDFYLVGDEFQSKLYTLQVIPKPAIISFSLYAEYPKYTQKKSEIFQNVSDITIPAGTKIKWIFNTKDSKLLTLITNDSNYKFVPQKDQKIIFNRKLMKDFEYKIIVNNEFVQNKDTLHFLIQVIPDLYPSIVVDEYMDSLSDSRLYFKGLVKDDYGFSKLYFKYTDKSTHFTSIVPIDIPLNCQNTQFFYYLDFTKLNLKEDEKIEYFFEIFDNDGVNGPKSARSQLFEYNSPSEKELNNQRNQRSDDLKNKYSQSLNKASKLQKEISKLQESINNKKDMSWQDKEKLENLLKQFDEVQKNLSDLKKENLLKNLKDKDLKQELDEQIVEKQKQLEDLMEKLLTPEMKDLLEQMRKMLEKEMQKDDALKLLDQLKLENKDIEKQLDRDLEIFKQLEFDKKFQDAIDKIDQIQKQQEKLQEETETKKLNSQELKKKQDELNKDFKDFKENMKQVEKANQDLEKPNNLDKFEEEQNSIEEDMKNSSNDLDKQKSSNASKSQKSASQKMQSLSEKMKKQQSDMDSEQMEEDIAALRSLLDNLIQTSFNQEKLIGRFQNTPNTDPKYPKLIQEQKKIGDDLKIIEDSLLALSKRQPSIEPFVNREISEINRNVESTLSALTDMHTIGYVSGQDKSIALNKQQYVLTSVNNLALMLDESLKQMQQQQMEAKSGKGKKCSKPKPGQGMSSLKNLQQQLNQQMKDMQQQMKDGQNKPGGQKQGSQMSEQFSKMAAQQEALRRKVQEYQDQLKKEGLGEDAKMLNKAVDEMEQTETDLVNKRLSNEMLQRQQDISTRLLDAEKAERERDEQEQRKSTEAKDIYQRNFEKFIEYNKLKSKETELLKTIPAGLKPFYKNRVNNYFDNIRVN